MDTTVHIHTTIYPVCLLLPLSPISIISLSSSMLTCKTPPHAVLSKQPVKLMVDSVERYAPVLFTYNEDPIIKSIQPSRSFVRLELNCFMSFCSIQNEWWSALIWFSEMPWISLISLQTACFFHLKARKHTGEFFHKKIWINVSVLDKEETSRRWQVVKLIMLRAGSFPMGGNSVSVSCWR